MRFCPNCGTKLDMNLQICPKCRLDFPSYITNIRAGEGSINFANGNGNSFTARDVNIYTGADSYVIDYECVQKKLFSVKTLIKFTIILAILMVPDWFFVIKNPETIINMIPLYLLPFLLMITFGCPALLIAIFIFFNEKKISILGSDFVFIDKHTIGIEAFSGECPICGGKVFIKKYTENTSGNQTNKVNVKLIGVCVNSDEHKFTFDRTILKGERLMEILIRNS